MKLAMKMPLTLYIASVETGSLDMFESMSGRAFWNWAKAGDYYHARAKIKNGRLWSRHRGRSKPQTS